MPFQSEHAPLYARLESALAAEIAAARLAPGDQLPPENSLIERFGVSRPTVRKAIENLVARGLVEIRRGRGTFVAQPKITQELTELTGFVEDMAALGRNPTARLIDKRLLPADAHVAQRLGLTAGVLVMRILRVRLCDGVAMSLDETYLPRDIGEKVVAHDLDAEPIFSLLEGRYDLPLIEAEYRLEAVAAAPDVAQALAIDPGGAIFRIERTSYTSGRRPIDYEKLHYRGDLISFVTTLARHAPDRS